MALPPLARTFAPASVARGWTVAIIPEVEEAVFPAAAQMEVNPQTGTRSAGKRTQIEPRMLVFGQRCTSLPFDRAAPRNSSTRIHLASFRSSDFQICDRTNRLALVSRLLSKRTSHFGSNSR